MKSKSLDFIVGYVFAKMDRSIFKQFSHNDTKETLVESITVPKIWFGLSSCQQVTNDIKGDEKYVLRENICEALNSIYPRLETICERIIPEKCYIRFDFKVKYKEQVKKMTIEEIEEALGYKIEIVSDK
jgi:hypothetical protein